MNVYAIALVFTHVFLAPAGQTTKQGSLLHVIANEIQDRKISKLVVLQYPQYAGSIFTITPAELNKVYQFRTEVRQLTLWGRTREFVALLQTPTGTTAHRRSPGEVRLACLFYDNNGNQRHTIYINTLGTACFVDGKIATLPKKLSPWLKHVFGGNLEGKFLK